MGDRKIILFPNESCTESYGDSYADSDTCRQPLRQTLKFVFIAKLGSICLFQVIM
jgi:hypothetical protein